ncbi:MAG TPA: hypothetical protein VG148_10260, partial [Pyrinomonadaceae bacterium]|nr:hypothetical protein [Pyrinomonadaceae bacterium]
MKKLPLLSALFASACLSASAQTTYRFDNFDVPDGVRVTRAETPRAAAPPRRLKLTARTGPAARARTAAA